MNVKNWEAYRHVNWRPDRVELRKFSVSMLVGFAVLGGIAAVRHQDLADGAPFWIAGFALALAGQIRGVARPVYLAVYLFANTMGFFISRAILTTIYAVLFVPIGLLLRLAGKDPLRLRTQPLATWRDRPPTPPSSRYYRTY